MTTRQHHTPDPRRDAAPVTTPLAYDTSTIHTSSGHGSTLVKVHASIFVDNRDALLATLLHLADTAPARIVIDLSDVPICDAAALSMLVQTHRRAITNGGWLRLACPRPLVRQVLHITNLDQLIPMYSDTAAAHDP